MFKLFLFMSMDSNFVTGISVLVNVACIHHYGNLQLQTAGIRQNSNTSDLECFINLFAQAVSVIIITCRLVETITMFLYFLCWIAH